MPSLYFVARAAGSSAASASATPSTAVMGPVSLLRAGSVVGFVVLLYFRRFFDRAGRSPGRSCNLTLLFVGWAMTDPNFRDDRHQARQRADRRC